MSLSSRSIGYLFSSLVLAYGASTRAEALFRGIGDLPGGWFESSAYGVSADGRTVVGSSQSREFVGDDFGWEAVSWTIDGGLIGLGGLPGFPVTSARAVSGDGSALAGSARLGNNAARAFRWTAGGGMQDLGTLGNYGIYGSSYATGISADGNTVVGRTTSATGFEAFRWTPAEGMVALGTGPGSTATGVSGNGQVIVGYMDAIGGFRWTAETGIALMGEYFARAVSFDGSTIIGTFDGSGGVELAEGFRWTDDEGFVSLGRLPAGSFDVRPTAVSGDGSLIAGYFTLDNQEGVMHAFLWDAHSGMRDLRDVLLNEYGISEVADWTQLAEATGISEDGRTIVGYGIGPRGPEGWVVTIPEPATVWLLIVGSLRLTWRGQRRSIGGF